VILRHGLLIIHDLTLVYANVRAAELMGCKLDELESLIGPPDFAWSHADDRPRLEEHLAAIKSGLPPTPIYGVRLNTKGDHKTTVDVHLSSTFNDSGDLQVLWIEVDNQVDPHSQVEDDVMRDILAALASAADLQQALEIILINLHNLIHYDRVGLFLSEDVKRTLVPAGLSQDASRSVGIALQDNPLVAEFRRTGESIIVQDIQKDERFSSWSDMEPVRGWLGTPLLAGDQVIGFLSMGSLKVGAYKSSDAALMQAFAARIAEVLEKAWTFEQSQRRTEQLEDLSNITSALGQAEHRADTLSAIIDEITRFLGAHQSILLLVDQISANLVIKVSGLKDVLGYQHPRGEDILWQVFDERQTSVVDNLQFFIDRYPVDIFEQLCKNACAGAFIPLISSDRSIGVLCLIFEGPRQFSFQDVRLYDTIAEIAGTSIQRAVLLRSLERQVDIRTGQLSTLYEINAAVGEPTEIEHVLERILEIINNALGSPAAAIHFLNREENELQLQVQSGLPIERMAPLMKLSLADDPWRALLSTTEPLVVPDVHLTEISPQELPKPVRFSLSDGEPSFLGVPIKVENRVLGLLSVFGANVLENTVESIALLMTISDQIGAYIEREDLIRQAERAAVFEERQRLARELHDSVTQLLYSQVLFSGAGAKVLHQGKAAMVEDHLVRINQVALQALKEMRLLVYELRPSAHLDEGLVLALERRLDFVERKMGIEVDFEVIGDVEIDPIVQGDPEKKTSLINIFSPRFTLRNIIMSG